VILTPEELCLLTKRSRPKAQGRALDFMGIPFRIRRDGTLVVSRASVDTLLGISPESVAKSCNSKTPNWTGI
jgi:hypothetical protein